MSLEEVEMLMQETAEAIDYQNVSDLTCTILQTAVLGNFEDACSTIFYG